jgi:hypothetical protein
MRKLQAIVHGGLIFGFTAVGTAGATQVPHPEENGMKPLAITVDQPAYAGEPIWIHAPAGKYFIRYPFYSYIGYVGCNRVELRYEGEAMKPWAMPSDMISYEGILCGSAAQRGSPPDRLPLHVLYPILKPGRYAVRWVIEEPNFENAKNGVFLKDFADSGWTPFTVLGPTPEERQNWLSRLLAKPPTDPGLLAGDYIPSLVAAAPDEQAMQAIAGQLYSSNSMVTAIATSALRFFPEASVRDAIFHLIEKNGPSEAIANILGMDSFGVASDSRRTRAAHICFGYLGSQNPEQQAAAIKALQVIAYFPGERLPAEPSLVAETDQKVLEAAPGIVTANEDAPMRHLAVYLGLMRSDRAHQLLERIASSASPAAEQARIALLWHPEPGDLSKVGAAMFEAGKADDGRELSPIPYSLVQVYGDEAIPIVRRAMNDSPYIFVRTSAAEELVRKNDPAAFAFFRDAIVNNRWAENSAYQGELIRFLKDAFPTDLPPTANRDSVVRFLRARSKAN